MALGTRTITWSVLVLVTTFGVAITVVAVCLRPAPTQMVAAHDTGAWDGAAPAADTHDTAAHAAAAQDEHRRHAEVVVLAGDSLAPFVGATSDELWLWVWRDGGWHLEASQLDERLPDGTYTASEDGVLDEDDEFVFNLPDGGVAPAGEWPPGLERRQPPLVVRVTDPLDPSFERVAYVFLAREGPEVEPPPLVSYDFDAAKIASDAYVLGFGRQAAEGFVGFRYLALFGDGPDLLDRMKIRLSLNAFGTVQTVTEEQLGTIPGLDLGALTPNPVIIGPVRIVLTETGSAVAYPERVVFRLDGLADFQLPPLFSLDGVRASLDFSVDALPGTYRDANVTEGVPIDGVPDGVPASPVPAWREMTLPDGRLVILSAARPGANRAEVYYRDDESGDPADTGDGKSLSDNGVAAVDMNTFIAADFPGQMVFVPTGHAVTAAQLAENDERPLLVTVAPGDLPDTPVPTETAVPSPTSSEPTPTSGAGPTATDEPTRAPTGTGGPTPGPTVSSEPPTTTAVPSSVPPTAAPTEAPEDVILYVPFGTKG